MAGRTQPEDSRDTLRQRCYESYVSSFKSSGAPELSVRHSGYRRWLVARYGKWLRALPPSAPILDIGCGAGDMLCFLQQEGFTAAEGLDISPEQIERARERGCRAALADAFDALPSRTGQYAAVLALDVLEHFTKDELPPLLTLIHRALAERGILIVKTPNGASPFAAEIVHDDLTHCCILGPAALAQLLRLSGFRDIHISESGPLPYGLRGIMRTVLWKLVRCTANTIKRIESGRTQPFWSENIICCCRKGDATAG